VEWASQLMPPNVGDVRNALREENPRLAQGLRAGIEHGVDLR